MSRNPSRRSPLLPKKTTWDQIVDFLYSRENDIGSAMGIAALALHFQGTVTELWPYIVATAYTAGYLLGLSISTRTASQEKHTKQLDDIERDLAHLYEQVKFRLPREARDRVHAIITVIEHLLPTLRHGITANQNGFIVRRSVESYLPDMLEAYLRLPREFANSHRLSNDRTPTESLIEQLTLLENSLIKIEFELLHEGSQALLAHGRFLEEKFGGGMREWPI
ncbi:MAG: hypothetical protein AB1344_08750 [Pseudomonadota bacterium]